MNKKIMAALEERSGIGFLYFHHRFYISFDGPNFGFGDFDTGVRFSNMSPGNFNIGSDKYIFECFFADYTAITDMVLGQCFNRIIRF